ncbi:MAG: isopentenyl-diphosphate Delta-isomerase [bacterium]|nr:isopentenyl-diphosphate Delta-isomerase [bacterium]
MDDLINLVDSSGKRIGGIEKLEAHKKGKLHEAFSIFIFNEDRELLLQKRAKNKYHSGGLWSNTCCSHASLNEPLEEAVHRRLKDELGIDSELKELFPIVYTANFPNGLTENEFDYIFIGFSDAVPKINPSEASDFKWVKIGDLITNINAHPQDYTEWLKIILRNESFLKYVLQA